MSLSRISAQICNATVNHLSSGIMRECVNKETFFQKDDKNEDVVNAIYVVYSIFIIVFGILYFLAVLALWIRVAYYAFKISYSEGLSSIFFYQLYFLYKFGDFIDYFKSSVMDKQGSIFS